MTSCSTASRTSWRVVPSSTGSIVGMILCSVFSFIVTDNLIINFTILILALFTIFLHRENIVRIIKGTERKLSFKK